MKNNSKLKIFISIITIAILMCAPVGISASAEDVTAPDIISKNVKVNGNFCLMFAVDPETVSGETVTLNIYNADPDTLADEAAIKAATVQTITKNKTDTQLEALDGDGKKDDSVIVFETLGVSAKDIADVWYITASSGDSVSAVETYSVREYAYERLYEDGKVSANDPTTLAYRQRTFYLKLLEIGAAAQELLENFDSETGAPVANPEKLANAYNYASIKGGSFTELSASRGFVEIGDTLTLAANADESITKWSVVTYDNEGAVVSSETYDNGAAIIVAGNTVVTKGLIWGGVTPGHYFDDYGNSYFTFDNLTASDLASTDGSLTTDYFRTNASYLTDTADTAGYYELVTDTETGNKYIKFSNPGYDSTAKTGNDKSSRTYMAFKSENIGGANANCVVFEADVYLNNCACVDNNKTTRYIYFGAGSNTYDELAFASPTGSTSELTTYSYFTTTTESTAEDTTKSYYPMNESDYSVAHGGWNKVTIEMYDNDTETNVKIYVGGEFLYGYKVATDLAIDTVESYMLVLQNYFHQYDFALDNIFVGKIQKDYVEE